MKEKAIIVGVSVNDSTFRISLVGPDGGWTQDFGGFSLSKHEVKDITNQLTHLFNQKDLNNLIGMECHPIRSLSIWGSLIEGLETVDGKFFSINNWRRSVFG